MATILFHNKWFFNHFYLLLCYSLSTLVQSTAAYRAQIKRYFNDLVYLFRGKRRTLMLLMASLSADRPFFTAPFPLPFRFLLYYV
jgi:hypothetical protein